MKRYLKTRAAAAALVLMAAVIGACDPPEQPCTQRCGEKVFELPCRIDSGKADNPETTYVDEGASNDADVRRSSVATVGRKGASSEGMVPSSWVRSPAGPVAQLGQEGVFGWN